MKKEAYPFYISVGSNPVHGFKSLGLWRVQVGSQFDFGRRNWVWKGLKFGLGGRTWVRVNLKFDLVKLKPGSSQNFVIFGFNPTLIHIQNASIYSVKLFCIHLKGISITDFSRYRYIYFLQYSCPASLSKNYKKTIAIANTWYNSVLHIFFVSTIHVFLKETESQQWPGNNKWSEASFHRLFYSLNEGRYIYH